MIPRYGEWQKRWKDKLTVIGVHTPELEAERDVEALRKFVAGEKIEWRVPIDPDMAAWERFGVQAWPTIVVIDQSGVVRSVHVGDDSGPAIEAQLKSLVR